MTTRGQRILEKIETIKQRARERQERYREILESGGSPVFDTTIFGGTILESGQEWVSEELEEYLNRIETAFAELANGTAGGSRLGKPERMLDLIQEIDDDSFALLTEAKNDDIPAVRIDVADWTGDAGTAFLEYLNDWETKAEYQREYLQEFGRLLTAFQRILQRQQKAALRIADACITALENPNQQAGSGDEEAGLFFTVLGAVVAVANANPLVGAGVSLASGLDSYLDAKRGGDDNREHDFPMNAMYLDELFNDTLAAIDKAWDDVVDELTELQGVADQYYNEHKGEGIWHLQLERPLAADSGAWERPPTEGDALALDLAQAYMAGQHRMPAASWYYEEAKSRLSTAMRRIETAIGADPSGHYASRFTTLQDIADGQLNHVFASTATDLTDTGANLVTAVNEYIATDASLADMFRDKVAEFENAFEVPTERRGGAGYEEP